MDHVLSATLELRDRFSSKIKSAGAALKVFQSENKKTGSAVKDTATCIQESAKSMKALAATFGGYKIATAAFSFLKDAYTGYAEFDNALTKNKAIMGANADEAAILKKQAMDLGRTMPFTAREIAEAQKYQAMAGYKANDIIAMTPKLLKLSIASGEDLARTSDIMTDNLDAFGLKLSEADRLMDVMAATANNTNTSISMLGEAYTYVGAASRQFDSFEEVNVILGILANNGIKAGKAGRNLAAIYARLAKPTDDMIAEFSKAGTTLYDTSGKFKGLRKIIAESKPALDRMTEAQRNQWIATVAGTEGLKVWASIAGYSAEGMDKVTKAVYNSRGAVEEINKEMENTPQNKIKALESAWEGLKLAIADGASPVITGLVEDLTKKINNLSDSNLLKKENVEDYFNNMLFWTKTAIGSWAALKLAILAATHPFIAAATAGIMGGLWLGKKMGLDKYGAKVGKRFAERDKARHKKEMNDWRQERFAAELAYKQDFGRDGREDFNNRLKKANISNPHNLNRYLRGFDASSVHGKENLQRRIVPGQNRIPQIPNIPVPQLQPQNEKKEVNVNLHVNLSGTVMKETVDNKKIADELSKYLFKEYKTQSLLQM